MNMKLKNPQNLNTKTHYKGSLAPPLSSPARLRAEITNKNKHGGHNRRDSMSNEQAL